MNELINQILQEQGRTRYWLAVQAEKKGICSQGLVLQFLAGTCNITSGKLDELFKILGVKVTADRRAKRKIVRK